MLDRPEEYQKMYDVELKLWWYRHLHNQVLNALEHTPRNAHIADLACGTGGLLLKLKEAGFNNVIGADISEHSISFCRTRGFDAIQCDLRNIETIFSPSSLDIIICNDALCYFNPSEQDKIVEIFLRLLKPKGRLLMNLPSLQSFSGMHDLGVGIVHRFSSQDIKRLSSGFKKSKVRFWPLVLAPLIYFTRFMQRKKIKNNSKGDIKSDVSLPSSFVNNMLYFITSFEMLFPLEVPLASSAFVEFQAE